MLELYHLPEPGVNSTPVTGSYLSHNHLDPVHRAFFASDLHSGARRLVQPTMMQAAFLARINVTYAWWAHKRRDERGVIELGLVPLVPPHPKTNGTVLKVPPSAGIDDSELVNIAKRVGPERMLTAAVMAEKLAA